MSASSAPFFTILIGFGLLAAGPAVALDSSVTTVQARGDAWAARFADVTGEGVVVAVLDTGVDDEHATFADAFVTGVDLSSPLIGNADPECSNPDDRDGHGTHVAGIILGRGVNGEHRGVAPGAMLVDVKVATDVGAGLDGLTRGLEWVKKYNAGETTCTHASAPRIHVVSVSLGTRSPGDPASPLAKAAQALVDAGVVVVAAAGNCGPGAKWAGTVDSPECARTGDNTVASPAVAPGVIAVASFDDRGTPAREDDGIALSSSRGPMSADAPKPDVAAPGVGITSASASRVGGAASGWTAKSGTSMAAPHVSGVAALLLGLDPGLSPRDVKNLVTSTATDRGPDGWDPGWGHGAVNALRAVATVAERPLSPPAPAWSVSCTFLECRFDASASTHPDGVPLVEFAWDFHDGSRAERATGTRVTHAFPRAGAFTVTLTVTDAEGRQASEADVVNVAERPPPPEVAVNEPPRARAHVDPAQGPPGTVFHFDARESTDAEGNITNVTWDVGDDGVVDAEGWNFTWTDAPRGVHPVKVTVTDAAGNSDTVMLTVLVDESAGARDARRDADVTAPRVEILAPTPGVVVESPVKVKWDAWDANRIVRYVVELDGRVVDEPRATTTLVRAEPGVHHLVVRAVDAAGNEGVAETTFSVPGAAEPADAQGASSPDGVRTLRFGDATPENASPASGNGARGASADVPAAGAVAAAVAALAAAAAGGRRRVCRKR